MLADKFDVVLMLTWSDWHSEPRSNRYHYAVRFAKELPVMFVQAGGRSGELLRLEPTAQEGIEIVHLDSSREAEASAELLDLLFVQGRKRVLAWIYNPRDYNALLEMLANSNNNLFVYHATEDYFSASSASEFDEREVASWVRSCIGTMDVVIGVSEAVTNTYSTHTESSARYETIENGCDAELSAELVDRLRAEGTLIDQKSAIFQGGINSRLDFSLLSELVTRLPNWQFVFCGRENETITEWQALKSMPNVDYRGELSVEELGSAIYQSTVGLIPFRRDDWIKASFPLKAFEYVSFGLPVVTVPIDALAKYPDLFFTASTAEKFAIEIERAAPTRHSQAAQANRFAHANENSYDKRFEKCKQTLVEVRRQLPKDGKLNIAVLYCERSTHIGTIREHLEAFQRYSHHNVYYLPATGDWGVGDECVRETFDLSIFDVIVIHYSVRLSLENHFSEPIAKQVEAFVGVKVLFIQDEYEHTEIARRWMDRLRIGVVYTCVPLKYRELIYPSHRFPGTEFLPTLTGYVPELDAMDKYAKSIEKREVLIAYRGRTLPAVYGALGYEKYQIGVEVKRLAKVRSLNVDIEVDDSHRIYGADWYRFLGSARATLGTESGASIFDFTGEVASEIEKATRKNPAMSFAEIQEQILVNYDLGVQMNQISPKVFEAIRLRTGLVLFEGEYSGVVRPNEHYIPLKKDFSNVGEVFTKLQDVEYMSALTERAYRDVILSREYSYSRFIEDFDRDLKTRHRMRARVRIASIPAFTIGRDGDLRYLSTGALRLAMSTEVLGGEWQREQIVAGSPMQNVSTETSKSHEGVERAEVNTNTSRLVAGMASVWRLLPMNIRSRVVAKAARYVERSEKEHNKNEFDFRIVRAIWHLFPERVRSQIAAIISR